jgi:hypothetical protein
MTLDIAGDTFLFVPTADDVGSAEFQRALYTISILRLNVRDDLPVARREAYDSYRARLVEYASGRDSGESSELLKKKVDALKRMQHPTVWHEMRRQFTYIPELTQLFQRIPEALNW